MACDSVCVTMREDEKMPEKNNWDVVFLIVLGGFFGAKRFWNRASKLNKIWLLNFFLKRRVTYSLLHLLLSSYV